MTSNHGSGKGPGNLSGNPQQEWPKPTGLPPEAEGEDDGIGASIRTVQWEGMTYRREVDGFYRDAWGRVLTRFQESSWRVEPPGQPVLVPRSLRRWAGKAIPPAEWLWRDAIPLGQCTLLQGIPSSRKSTFLLNLALSVETGQPYFLGTGIRNGKVLAYFCEDPDARIAERAACVARHLQVDLGAIDFEYFSSDNMPPNKLVYFTPEGVMKTTPAWDAFREQIVKTRPILVILDLITSFWIGNENDRNKVDPFLRLLDALAQEFGLAIVFTAHASRNGMRDKTLTSGSTAWEGCVRARLIIEDPEVDEDGKSLQSNKRKLTLTKSNYSMAGAEFNAEVVNHTFIGTGAMAGSDSGQKSGLDHAACMAKTLDLLDEFWRDGIWTGKRAHVVLGEHCATYPAKAFEKAMMQLKREKKVKLTSLKGPDRHPNPTYIRTPVDSN